jgi:hypothetical protein
LIKHGINNITAKNLSFYPDNTHFYVDVDLNNKNSNTNILNNTSAQTAINFFNNKNKFINSPSNKKHLIETFGQSFSFGKWYKNINGKDYELNLSILPIQTSGTAYKLLSQLLDKKEKFSSRTYKGYKIIYFTKKRWVFLINGSHLYLSNNVIALKYVIDSNILHRHKGMKANPKIKKIMSMMQEYRLATVILNNTKQSLSETDRKKLSEILLIDFVTLPKTTEPVATAVYSFKNSISIKSFTNMYVQQNKSQK